MRATASENRFRRPALLAVALVFFGGFAAAHDQVPGAPQSRPIVLRGGDLYTVSGGVLAGTDLLFEDGKIVAIGPSLAVPDGTEEIDIAGRRVYPGLIAPQTTLGLVEIRAVRATRDETETGDVTPEVAAYNAFNPDSEVIPTVRSHGLTTAQIVPQGSLVRGRSFLVHLDGWTREDAAVKSADALQMSWIPATVQTGWRSQGSPEEQKQQMAESRRLLHQVFDDARAYDLARTADASVEVDLRWEAMRPIWSGELPVWIAADDYRQIVEAVEFTRARSLRMVLVGGRDAHLATDLLRENDIPVVLGSITALPERQDDGYDLPFRLPALLAEAGVRFCFAHGNSGGSWDARNLPFQAAQAVAFGLSQEAALRALTLGTAEILGIADREGSLEVGKDATLFVSTGDVMDALGQQVTLMFIDGRRIDLDNRHKELYRKYLEREPASGVAKPVSGTRP